MVELAEKQNATPLLRVDDLTVGIRAGRGTFNAIENVSFSLAEGEVLGLVGESGCGKSMTALALMGLLPQPVARVQGGSMLFDGLDLTTLSEHARRRLCGDRLGMIFQEPMTSLNPVYRVGDQLVEAVRAHRSISRAAAWREAVEMLDKVGIPAPEQRARAYPHELSGGMRQRVMIAIALSSNPRIIIADEPTTALDVSIQAQIIALLKRLCREHGTAVMLVTHDMGVIAETADRVAVMYAGRIAEIGPVLDVTRRPQHPYTSGLMGSIPSLRHSVETLVQIDGSMPRLDAMPPGCAFHPRCPEAGPRCSRERPAMQHITAACWLHQGGVQA
ncbi:MAG: ABC transporter ATP-binding protein [Candidatus Competibacteraceae bacterium]|nr:ABC transporter ATP-binding protein [Candidatus Competibacteraceae bacterium]